MNAFRRIATARPIATATASIALASVCFALVPLFARILLADGVSAEAIGLYRASFALCSAVGIDHAAFPAAPAPQARHRARTAA